ncbi:unnamed protein product [Boreogadus saida]
MAGLSSLTWPPRQADWTLGLGDAAHLWCISIIKAPGGEAALTTLQGEGLHVSIQHLPFAPTSGHLYNTLVGTHLYLFTMMEEPSQAARVVCDRIYCHTGNVK